MGVDDDSSLLALRLTATHMPHMKHSKCALSRPLVSGSCDTRVNDGTVANPVRR